MVKINILARVDRQIQEYIALYEEYFLSIFDNTGIWSEDQIRENYTRWAKELSQSVYALLRERVSQEPLPYSQGTDTRSVTLSLGNRRIALEYREEDNIRTITDIKIWYKH